MKTLFLILLFPLFVQGQIHREILQIQEFNNLEGRRVIDTVWVEFMYDTSRVLIMYIDTNQITTDYGLIVIKTVNNSFQWEYGYKVIKKEIVTEYDHTISKYPYGEPIYLGSDKKPFKRRIIQILKP